MSKEFLGDREQALETEFFRKQEVVLLDKLRAKLDHDTHKKALADNSAITDDAVLEHLVSLGIHANTLTALSIIPLLAVGWADGSIRPAERNTVIAAAVEHGIARGSEAWLLLERWLDEPPDEEIIAAWEAYMAAVAKSMDSASRARLKDQILAHAREIAEAAGGTLGIAPVSPGERSMLQRLEAALD
jgi:hypothetical protein